MMDKSLSLNQKTVTTVKIPPVTTQFWLVAILSAFLGETLADFLRSNIQIDWDWAVISVSGVLAFVLSRQVLTRHYAPWLYWSVLVLISLDCMMLTDHLSAHWPTSLELSCSLLFAALLVNFIAWFLCERTLSLLHINSIRRELFYWAAFFLSCALGTVIGDQFGIQLMMSYGSLAALAGVLIMVVTAVFYWIDADVEWRVWVPIVLVRPLGSSCADLLIKPQRSGGLGLDVTIVSLLALMAIILIVVGQTFSVHECTEAD